MFSFPWILSKEPDARQKCVMGKRKREKCVCGTMWNSGTHNVTSREVNKKIQRANQRRSPSPKPRKRRLSQFSEPNKKYHRSILHLFFCTTLQKKHPSMKISRITENPSQQSLKPQCILSFSDFLREASDSTELSRDKQSRPAALRTTEQV